MRNRCLAGAILAALMLCACNPQRLQNEFIPQPEAKIGQQYIDDIRTGNFAPVRDAIEPQLRDQIDSVLPEIKAHFTSGPVKSVKVVMANTVKSDGVTTYELGYEYEISQDWFYVELVMRRTGQTLRIAGIHMRLMQRSLEEANAFTFADKDALFYAFLVATLAVPLFIIFTAIATWRTAIPRYKWLWRIFVLFGFVGITLNWATGAVNVQPIQLFLLGAGFKLVPYGPLLLQLSIPFGAILFWWRRHVWLAKERAVVQDY